LNDPSTDPIYFEFFIFFGCVPHTYKYKKEYQKIIYKQKIISVKYLKVYNKFQRDRRLFENVDNPRKADLVEKDVEVFFETLENIAKKPEGLKQQAFGSMAYQKDVETIQISLLLLGYKLPRFGVDGLYGPETAKAIEEFKKDNPEDESDTSVWDRLKKWVGSIFEELNLVELKDMDFTHLKHDNDQTQNDLVNKFLLDDVALAAERAGLVAKIHFAQHGHPSMKKPNSKSRHKRYAAIDIFSIDDLSFYNDPSGFKEKGDKLANELQKMGYVLNVESGNKKAVLWQTKGHYNHLHVSNLLDAPTQIAALPSQSGSEKGDEKTEVDTFNPGSSIDPIYIALMIEKLRERGIKSTDLQRFIDIKNGGSVNFTLLDLFVEKDVKTYAEICQKFIDSYPPNLLGITGEMMSNSAKKAFDKHGSYIPPELALAQLLQEGGISNESEKSRPIRTKNPFNVGNTDSGENESHSTVESGIDTYFNLVARRYLTGGKTAEDLLQNYVNVNGLRYAGKGYETALSKIVPKANSIANQVLGTTQVQAQKQV
jgi:hypothetical protein